jgi:hypothetical protein
LEGLVLLSLYQPYKNFRDMIERSALFGNVSLLL